MGEKNVLLARTVSNVVAVLDPEGREKLYRSLSAPFGVRPQAVYSLVNLWKGGLVYASTSDRPHEPRKSLKRLSVFLNALSVSESHPLITELTRYEGFVYPPQEACEFSLTHREKLIVKLKYVDEKRLPEVETYLDGLLE